MHLNTVVKHRYFLPTSFGKQSRSSKNFKEINKKSLYSEKFQKNILYNEIRQDLKMQ